VTMSLGYHGGHCFIKSQRDQLVGNFVGSFLTAPPPA